MLFIRPQKTSKQKNLTFTSALTSPFIESKRFQRVLVVFTLCFLGIPDEVVELINLLLVVVGQRVLLPLLAFDE